MTLFLRTKFRASTLICSFDGFCFVIQIRGESFCKVRDALANPLVVFAVRYRISIATHTSYMHRVWTSLMGKFVDRLLVLHLDHCEHFPVVVIQCCSGLPASATITSVIHLFTRINALRRTCLIQLEDDVPDSLSFTEFKSNCNYNSCVMMNTLLMV